MFKRLLCCFNLYLSLLDALICSHARCCIEMKERKGREGERMPHFNGSTANQSAGGQGQRQCTRARSRAVHVRSCCSNAWQSSASRWFSWAICRDFWRSSSMTERVYAMLLKAFSLHPRQEKKNSGTRSKRGEGGARRSNKEKEGAKEEKGGERRRKEEKGGERRSKEEGETHEATSCGCQGGTNRLSLGMSASVAYFKVSASTLCDFFVKVSLSTNRRSVKVAAATQAQQ